MFGIRVQLRSDPVCPVHRKPYPRGTSCRQCQEGHVPTERRAKPRKTTSKVKTPAPAVPYVCDGCGRTVRNSQGICPGPDC